MNTWTRGFTENDMTFQECKTKIAAVANQCSDAITGVFSQGLSSCALHILAMLLMLCDHLWGTILPQQEWLTSVGRIAFPLFAFMIAEGYRHTKNVKKYLLRIFLFAILSEIPFNLMMSHTLLDLTRQNVMWTFLISVLLMMLFDRLQLIAKKREHLPVIPATLIWICVLLLIFVITVAAWIVGMATGIDYFGFGILMVLTFYLFKDKKIWSLAGQLICLFLINEELGGLCFRVIYYGRAAEPYSFEIVEQSLAVLALIPIWMYSGRQGYHAKWFQYFCYAFYPVHMLVLALLSMALS